MGGFLAPEGGIGQRMFAGRRPVSSNEAYWRAKLANQGKIQADNPSLVQKLQTKTASGLRKAGLNKHDANRIASKTLAALNDLTPVGNATMASDGAQDWQRGNRVAGAAQVGLAALPGAVGKAGRGMFGKGIRSLGEPSQLNTPRVPTAEEMAQLSAVQNVPLGQARHGNRLEWDKFGSEEYGQPLIPNYADKPVAVQLENGEYVLLDGNHRSALARHNGAEELPMHVIPARQYDPENMGTAPRPSNVSDDDLAALLAEFGFGQ